MKFYCKTIDWEAQWAAHAQNFYDGCVHIDFKSYGRSAPPLRLKPGGGFGDLSHPTTRLMLRMLAQIVAKQDVIDIGCGSGILSLAAAALGSPKVYGIDIEQEAVEHSRNNAIFNNLSEKSFFFEPANLNLQILQNRFSFS